MPLFVANNGIHALVLVTQYHHTFQALDALVIVHPTILANGVNATLVLAVLAGLPAAFDPFQPAEQTEAPQHRQPCTQRAQVAAVELVDEHADRSEERR